MAFKKSDLNRR